MARAGSSGGRSSGGSFGGSRSSGGRSGGSSFGGSKIGGSRGGSVFGGSSGRRSGSFSSGKSRSGGVTSGGSTGRSGGSFGGTGGGIFRNDKGSGGSYGGGGGSWAPRPGQIGGGGRLGCGCVAVIIGIIIIGIILLLLMAGGNSIFSGLGSTEEITVSTIQREPLPAGSVNETKYYTDELDWIGNETQLLKGLKHFYQKTGVQPYLYITDTINGSHYPSTSDLDQFANKLYDELFTDEAHLLFVFFEYNGTYSDRYVAGTQAKTVIDKEAADILLDYIDRYYYDDNKSDEEFFSTAFKDAADRIMTVTRSPWITVLTLFGLLALVIALFIWWKRAKKQKNQEIQEMKEIINKPLEKFGDSEADALARKYEETGKFEKNNRPVE